MLTTQDIYTLQNLFVIKEEFFEANTELNRKFDVLLTAVDNYAKRADQYYQEMMV